MKDNSRKVIQTYIHNSCVYTPRQ